MAVEDLTLSASVSPPPPVGRTRQLATYPPLAYCQSMVLIETPVFTRQIQQLMNDEDYREFQNALISDPTRGELVPGGGGIRKIRAGLPGRGKRGGARVIYFWQDEKERIFLLLAYAKSAKDNLSRKQVAQLRDIAKEI